LGRRAFTLTWDDPHAFAPDAPRNPDGSVTRAQVFFCNPQKYLDEGFSEAEKQGVLF
jgi:hypothetical protein